MPLLAPVMPHPDPYPKYRHLVIKSGTSAGHHGIWLACGSGWCLVRCTPTPSLLYATSMPPPQYSNLVAKIGTTSGQLDSWWAFGSGWPVYSRVNLVPADIVIPAPWADIKVVAVKKLFTIVFSRPSLVFTSMSTLQYAIFMSMDASHSVWFNVDLLNFLRNRINFWL